MSKEKYIEAANQIDWFHDEDATRSFIVDKKLYEAIRSRMKPLDKPVTVTEAVNYLNNTNKSILSDWNYKYAQTIENINKMSQNCPTGEYESKS